MIPSYLPMNGRVPQFVYSYLPGTHITSRNRIVHRTGVICRPTNPIKIYLHRFAWRQ